MYIPAGGGFFGIGIILLENEWVYEETGKQQLYSFDQVEKVTKSKSTRKAYHLQNLEIKESLDFYDNKIFHKRWR